MITARSMVVRYIEQGVIAKQKIAKALEVTGVRPDKLEWRLFIDRLLLWLGGLSLAFAAMFFIAYNWSVIGRYGKFALVEGLIILAIVTYCRAKIDSTLSKVALLVATISLGVLLALLGQVYQTGADPWQLFFTWALLMLPWAMIGRFSAIWIIWLLLINITITLYYFASGEAFILLPGSDKSLLWQTALFNSLALAVWEILLPRLSWLSGSWAPRLLALQAGVALTWLPLLAIFSSQQGNTLSFVGWLIWLVTMVFIYQRKRVDLFMLAGCCLSVIVVTTVFIGKELLKSYDASGFILLAFMVIALGGGAGIWLKKIYQEQNNG